MHDFNSLKKSINAFRNNGGIENSIFYITDEQGNVHTVKTQNKSKIKYFNAADLKLKRKKKVFK